MASVRSRKGNTAMEFAGASAIVGEPALFVFADLRCDRKARTSATQIAAAKAIENKAPTRRRDFVGRSAAVAPGGVRTSSSEAREELDKMEGSTQGLTFATIR